MKTKTKLLAAAVAGAAAAGYYFYGSPGAKKNRRVAASWATKMKKDVLTQAKELKNLDRSAMIGIVDGVAKAYQGMKGLDRSEILQAASELKKNWEKLNSELKKTGNAASRDVKKGVRGAIRRAKGSARKATSSVRKAARA